MLLILNPESEWTPPPPKHTHTLCTMASSNGNIFRVTVPVCGELHRWCNDAIWLTKWHRIVEWWNNDENRTIILSSGMVTSSNGSIFSVTGPLWGESTGNRSVDSPHKGQWRGALICSLNCAWTNNLANNRDAHDLRHRRVHYYVTVMRFFQPWCNIIRGLSLPNILFVVFIYNELSSVYIFKLILQFFSID